MEENNQNVEQNSTENKEPNWEEQVKALMQENAKLKKAMDKSASEAASYKKQLREKQTADEIALQEKAEKDAEREKQFQDLLRENNISKLEKNFISLGYTSEQATKAATAQIDGDTDSLFKIQSDVQAGLLKAKEQEWLKNRPSVNAGVGGNTNITKEQFKNMSITERQELFTKDRATYEMLKNN